MDGLKRRLAVGHVAVRATPVGWLTHVEGFQPVVSSGDVAVHSVERNNAWDNAISFFEEPGPERGSSG